MEGMGDAPAAAVPPPAPVFCLLSARAEGVFNGVCNAELGQFTTPASPDAEGEGITRGEGRSVEPAPAAAAPEDDAEGDINREAAAELLLVMGSSLTVTVLLLLLLLAQRGLLHTPEGSSAEEHEGQRAAVDDAAEEPSAMLDATPEGDRAGAGV